MSSSASKSKPKKTSNLRILWIPGRKKHNRKGTFNPTKSGLPQTYGMQPRKNEPWTLGGPLNHSKIINAELPEHHLDLATMAGITTGAMSLVSKGTTEPDANCAAMPQIATTELNGSSTNPEAIATSTTEQPQPVEDEGAVGGRSSPSSTIVVPIELNNLNGGDVANSKEKEIATSNQFEALALIDEDEEPEVKDRNCSNAQSSSSLLSSNNDNRSVENVHNGSTLAIGEQHQAQQNQQQQQQQQQKHSRQRRRSTASKKNSADEDIDSIDRADSAVDMVRAFAEREPHLFEYLDNGVPYLKRKPRTPCVVMMKKERRRNRSRKRSTVRRRSQQACGIQAMKSNEKQELLDEVDGKMKKNPKSKEPDDAAVECLYWSLVCWDCNIL
ncbi:putative uncharacterized protein DDB_G0277255 isoform X2 [Anopheles aquasalis]|uniref:putative uncharacterized protein DDB_G0277255 isoform X2 n=1 Tax=Anopheles aquasalis TaxID=42839 RepID=UPI00215AEB21|nr:putative uncharacterized protein DDB_G0277255 isoform X2 [Anopheles aquasalis]